MIIDYKHPDTAVLTLNRPESLNALNRAALEELFHFLNAVGPQKNLKAIVLTGAGNKAFAAGADIKEMESMNPFEFRYFLELGQKVTNFLENSPLLTFAAVNGYALGGGFELALSCDFIYAIPEAEMGLPEINLGILPGFGGIQRLARTIGVRKTKEMVLSGKKIGAVEASRMGIVNQIYPREELITKTMDSIKDILSHSWHTIISIKHACKIGSEMKLLEALELEKELCTKCFDTPERAQSMKKFIAR